MKISLHRGLSPKAADVAFASISANGTPGPLNEYVLSELGYDLKVLDGEKLHSSLSRSGFAMIREEDRVPILLIVTVGGATKLPPDLERNLSFAFDFHKKDLAGKVLWMPMMGTGAGSLTYAESLSKILAATRTIQVGIQPREIQLGVPTNTTDEMIQSLVDLMDYSPDFDFDQALSGFKGSVYAVGSDWGEAGDQSNRFIQEGVWENGDEEQRAGTVNEVKTGDILLMKSTFARPKEAVFRLKAVGVVMENLQNGRLLKVDWQWKVDNHDIVGALAKFRHRISVMLLDDFLKIADSIGRERTSWQRLFNKAKEVIGSGKPSLRYWWWNTRMSNLDLSQAQAGQQFMLGAGRSGTEEKGILDQVFLAHQGDLILAYQVDKWDAVMASLEVIELKGNEFETVLSLQVIQRFKPVILFEQILGLPSLQASAVLLQPEIDFKELSATQYAAILHLRETETYENSLEPESKIANLVRDTVDGDDYFDIGKDVEAFAKVIAARSFQPPLAIALFGKWGTGKSFFMNKLKTRIKQYAKDEKNLENPTYCRGVAHIHFNAWSYLDANLWASLVTLIFEGLNTYIGINAKEDEKKTVEAELQSKLQVIQEGRDALKTKMNATINDLEVLTSSQADWQRLLEEEIRLIQLKTWQDVLRDVNAKFKVEEEITKALNANEKLSHLKTSLDELLPKAYREHPELAIQELKSTRTIVREFMSNKKLRNGVLVGVFVTILVLVLPALLMAGNKDWRIDFLLVPQLAISALALLTPILAGYKKIYDVLKPVIAEVWKVKTNYEAAVNSARFSHEQEMEARKLRIQQHTSEIERMDERIGELDREIIELNFKLNHALATETLYSFIEKRAASEDYKKHLGIISTIRKDFEILSDLFQDSGKEAAENVKEFHARFDTPLQRIVLYVDDLDRCPENRVIEVLEAMNLLMAFPLFVVVVGVDPRWVKNALLQKYSLQFGSEKQNGYEPIDASDYLEKIFQVPFHLQQADDEDVKKMLWKLTEHTVEKKAVKEETSATDETKKEEKQVENTEIASVIIDGNSVQIVSENLTLLEVEVTLMQEISPLLGNNPRAIKRFVNVYQIARAHEGLTIGDRKPESFFALMFLLALPIGPYRDLHEDFLGYLHATKDSDSGMFVKYLHNKDNQQDLTIASRRKELMLAISKMGQAKEAPKMLSKDLARHNAFIQRFTFADFF